MNIARFAAAALAGSLWIAQGATTNVASVGSFPNYAYNPKVVSVKAGDTVIWTGLAGIHSVTGTTAPETMCGSAFPLNCTNTFNTPGTYLYHCINHGSFGMTGVVQVAAVTLPPIVAITNPAAGAVFAASASLKLAATASSSGSVTNVQFFGNGASLGAVSSPPFNLTTAPLALGSYTLTATASATTGLSATSAPVVISVVAPVAISNYWPRLVASHFVFDHTANAGLGYVVERSASLSNWAPVVTNTATSNSVQVTDTFQVGSLRFYRIRRLPNP